jgi:Fe2+ or Zn2+ uptake regulation protein
VAETAVGDVRAALEVTAKGLGFQVERLNLEATGLCPRCAE